MSQRFAGRAAIVTGAASGIGAATARHLVAEGARVLLVDRADTVAATAAALGQRHLVLDIAAPDAGAVLARTARSVVGQIDILVNNAGQGGSRPLAETDDATLDRLIEVNLTAVIRLLRALTPGMTAGAAIVNISSTFGLTGVAGTTGYGVAKAGIAQLTRQLATELGPRGIRVNAIAPGVIETPMTAAHLVDPRYRRLHTETIPLGRIARPEEPAAAIAFLASEEASFITGVVLPVDGGYLACRHLPD